MKKMRYIALSFLVAALLLCFCACTDGEEQEEPALFAVTFDSNGGTAVSSQQIPSGELAKEPSIPVREGYIFDCWRNAETGQLWSFTGTYVVGNVTLRAEWIEASRIFEIERIGESDTARIIRLTDKERKEYTIPSAINGFTVVSIGKDAFSALDSEKVYKISLPETVTQVEEGAFLDCDGIKITVGGKLTAVGEQAFKNCDRLERITLAEGLTEISAEAFWGCSALRELRVPATVRFIGENAMQDCGGLRSIQICEGIESIGNSAFLGCNALKAVYFRGDEARLEEMLEEADALNDPLVDCEKFYLYSETKPERETVFEGYWYLDENNNFRLWKME